MTIVEVVILPEDPRRFYVDVVDTLRVCDATVGVGWSCNDDGFSPPPSLTFDQVKCEKSAAVNVKVLDLWFSGASVSGGDHIALDDSSRTGLG